MNLDDIRIATPCPASWADMAGDERKRFCGSCKLHVYNLAGMTRPDAEALVSNADGRVCIRLYRRQDGTILTRDCPIAVRRAMSRWLAGMAAGVTVLMAALLWGMSELKEGDRINWGRLAGIQPFKAIAALVRWAEPEPKPSPIHFTAGRMVAPTMGTPTPMPPPPATK